MKSPLSLITASATAKSLNIVGDQWSYLVLRDMFLGRHRFEELLASTGASRGTLTKRLQNLVEQGVLYRNPISQSRRFEYRLTDKGLSLYPLAIAAWLWELKWAKEEAAPLPRTLIHKNCNRAIQPIYSCRFCHEEICVHDVHYTTNDQQPSIESDLPTQQRRSRNIKNNGTTDKTLFHVIDAVSDRWTSLILAGAFMGADRFDTFHKELNVATNILADRLKKLVQNDILTRVHYQESPPRYSYKLTPKAYDLYSLLLSLHQWGKRWLEAPDTPSAIELTHKCSNNPLTPELLCNCCHQPLRSSDILFK
ncbi:helix-turn-helix domain-containing protein [Parendozoicomonas sp. Alg238-R29]|uniref:winged helix-turn-helix transcriptional regulator n=1 Tax=Parendozoicomonas sp. Alg238-R29 TaxID=2993446 RepID=UPI00248DCF77|nr:helix-turn-helix domain-containing protein [Parendozoicomonas sp. Alg238-R29]